MSDNLFLILGYIVFTVYTCGIMAVGAVIEKKCNFDKTICRKFVHIISSFVWIICWYFFGYSIHWVILNGFGAIILGLVTFCGKMNTFYGKEVNRDRGVFYFGLSTFIVALICYFIGEEVYLLTGIAYYCLALGDGFAPIFSKLLKKYNHEIMPNKSVIGTLTVFVISFLSTLTFTFIFKMHFDMLFIVSIASMTCVAEFYGIKGIDNLLIEFNVFGYLLLYYFGYVTVFFEIVVIVSPFIACIAMGSKSLSVSGGICALVLFYLIAFFGSPVSTLFTATLFLIATVISFVTHKLNNNGKVSSIHTRTGKQIVAVGLTSIINLIVYYFTGLFFFCALFYLTLTEQFADSMASDIGRLTKGKNIDIVKFKSVEKGISGGVSLLGTICALLASFILLLVPFLFRVIDLKYFLLLSFISFVCTLIDSVFGSVFQALYKCHLCGVKTENRLHCGAKAKLIKGFSWVDNTIVNLITSFATCGVGFILLLL